ncbi:MAG: outer membrane beta-barrel protein [Crocinitomicaceae bacterium]
MSAFHRLSLIFFLFLFASSLQAQIISGEMNSEEEKKEKKKKEKKPKQEVKRDSLSGTTYYLTGMVNYGYRSFVDNSVYGSYADWNDQKADYSGGGTIGVFLPLTGSFSLDLGFTYFGHKEKYNFDDPDSDSTYYFSNTYMQIGMPVKLRYTYGDKFQLFAFVGLTPVNILNVRFNELFTRMDGTVVERETELVKEKLSIFNLMGTAGVGLSYNFDWIGITLYPEYRHHLLNTYDPQKPLTHRMYGLAINAGITLRF